jgi:hypothetical protein
MKYITISLIALIFLSGCETNKPDWSKYRGENQKHTQLNKHDLLPDPFLIGVNYTLDTSQDFILYQAWDDKYPNICPVFFTRKEAQEYAGRNNFYWNSRKSTGHNYIVKEIFYRYEVRHQNESVDDVIFTSYALNKAEDYLNAYKANHTDLFIFDLMKQEIVGVNTP